MSNRSPLLLASIFRYISGVNTMIIRCPSPAVCLTALLAFACPAIANLIPNGNFEDGKENWNLWIPPESEDADCEFYVTDESPHSGKACAELSSLAKARYTIAAKRYEDGEVVPGKRYRLTYWIRMAENLDAKGPPYFLVRFMLLGENSEPIAGARALIIGLDGKYTIQALQGKLRLNELSAERPTTWTKVESVFEVPINSGATRLDRPGFFAMFIQGSIFLDDISLEEVDDSVTLSPSYP